MRAARFACLDRALAERFRAARLACVASAWCEAADRPSFFSARNVARERLADGFAEDPRPTSRLACLRARGLTSAPLGAASFTPARLAFERPMAIACLVERAPCLPSRMCSISSRTNSPACVDGAFPSRASPRARSSVCRSGTVKPPDQGLHKSLPVGHHSEPARGPLLEMTGGGRKIPVVHDRQLIIVNTASSGPFFDLTKRVENSSSSTVTGNCGSTSDHYRGGQTLQT